MHLFENGDSGRVGGTAISKLNGVDKNEMAVDARFNSFVTTETPNQLCLELRVRGTFFQAILDAKTVSKVTWNAAQELTRESLVCIRGHSQHGGEASEKFYVTSMDVVARASPDLPSFDNEGLSAARLEERLNNRILDVRHAASGAIFKLHSGVCQLIVEFLCSNGFHWIHTPRIITDTIPGDKEYFHLPYFGKDAWLAQSSQHHKQMALAMDMQRVFEIGPVFRAEVKSSTSSRHLTEFTVLDMAMTFQDDYHEFVQMVESMLVFVFKGLQERKQYKGLGEIVQKLYPSARPFRIGLDKDGKVPRITFLEAKRMLREDLGFDSDNETNFTEQEEAALGRHFHQSASHGMTDIFTIDQYPASMRQFNSQPSQDAPGLSNTWDIIVGGREISSGSERMHELDEVHDAMRAGICGPPIDPQAEEWQSYLSVFKTGISRHAGCGLGVNRLLQSFLGLQDVREVVMFPRDVNRLVP